MRSRTIIATPPGATIKEQLDDRGMTQKEFAVRMDMSEKHISKLINGEVHLTPSVAFRLESVLGIPASFWNNLEARYQEKKIMAEEENAMDADIELSKQMPYAEMVKLGWIEATRIATERVINLRRYFEVSRLGVIEQLLIPGIAYRRLSATDRSSYMLAVWAQKARVEARTIPVSPLNIQRLHDIVPQIRQLTLEDPKTFSPKLVEWFAECGIAMVVLPHMKGSFLHGASFYDGNKVVMGLTVRNHDADRFWFSLFHEVDHVLEGHIGQPDGPTDEDEDQANIFAANTLIPPQDYQSFVHRGQFSENSVRRFADTIGVDPGIVVGRLQNDRIILHSQMNSMKKQYCLA